MKHVVTSVILRTNSIKFDFSVLVRCFHFSGVSHITIRFSRIIFVKNRNLTQKSLIPFFTIFLFIIMNAILIFFVNFVRLFRVNSPREFYSVFVNRWALRIIGHIFTEKVTICEQRGVNYLLFLFLQGFLIPFWNRCLLLHIWLNFDFLFFLLHTLPPSIEINLHITISALPIILVINLRTHIHKNNESRFFNNHIFSEFILNFATNFLNKLT